MQMKKEIQVAYGIAAGKDKAESTAEATKAVEAIFERRAARTRGEDEGEDEEAEAEAGPIELTEEELAAKRDREERAAAFIQLAAAVAAEPEPAEEAATGADGEGVPVRRHGGHAPPAARVQLQRVQDALGQRQQGVRRGERLRRQDEYEGTHKGAELAQKWLTLAAQHGRL